MSSRKIRPSGPRETTTPTPVPTRGTRNVLTKSGQVVQVEVAGADDVRPIRLPLARRAQQVPRKSGEMVTVEVDDSDDGANVRPIRPSIDDLSDPPTAPPSTTTTTATSTTSTETETTDASVIQRVIRPDGAGARALGMGTGAGNKHKIHNKGSQTDWWLTDASKLEHPLRRTFDPSSTYMELDRIRGAPHEVNQIKLEDIKDSLDRVQLGIVVKAIVLPAFFLVVTGFAFFVHLLIVFVGFRPAEYLRNYFEYHTGAMLFMYLGIVNPILVGLYCFYCVRHLHSIRPYYWRVSIFLIIPIAIIIIWVLVLDHIDTDIQKDFSVWIGKYNESTEAHKILDETQTGLHCCGVKGSTDFVKAGQPIPDSCCSDLPNCFASNQYWLDGCVDNLKSYLGTTIVVFIIIASFQIVFQLWTMVGMKIFFNMVDKFFEQKPTILKMLIGPFGVLCECCLATKTSPVTEFPPDELEQHEFLPRDKRGDLVFTAPFPFRF